MGIIVLLVGEIGRKCNTRQHGVLLCVKIDFNQFFHTNEQSLDHAYISSGLYLHQNEC
jgi:hypothetical protein